MSAWGKFLAQVVSGGWQISFNLGGIQTATLAAGTYGSILEAAAAFQTSLQLVNGTFAVTVSSTGQVVISCGVAWTVNWVLTPSPMQLLWGFDSTETVDGSNVLTATNKHRFGWYPGTISWGINSGEGINSDDRWQPIDRVLAQYAGSGAARRIAPGRRHYRRGVRFGLLKADEAFDHDRGPLALNEQWVSLAIRWYPDRDLGAVGTPGTQMDPGAPYYEDDDAYDYWIVTAAEPPRFEQNASHPDYFAVVLVLAVEPK